jgi:uncharacterized protein (DUF488 family)
MKPQQVFEELKHLAEKLGIEVKEQNFRPTGIKVKSGLCVVRGKQVYVMNKHNPIQKKVALLAECLRQFEHDQEFVVPAIRELLGQKRGETGKES